MEISKNLRVIQSFAITEMGNGLEIYSTFDYYNKHEVTSYPVTEQDRTHIDGHGTPVASPIWMAVFVDREPEFRTKQMESCRRLGYKAWKQ